MSRRPEPASFVFRTGRGGDRAIARHRGIFPVCDEAAYRRDPGAIPAVEMRIGRWAGSIMRKDVSCTPFQHSRAGAMDRRYGDLYERLYKAHWWFRVRERILVSVIRGLGLPARASILDVGCGNGLFFDALERFGTVEGVEIDGDLVPEGSPFRGRIHGEPLGHPVYAGRHFDLITALDVIEHIEDDAAAVDAMVGMLRPGGTLLLTVPASMKLWDEHDRMNHHFRRYTASDLRGLLAGRAAEVRVRHLFHALFLPKWAVATGNRLCGARMPQHGIPPGWLNRWAARACWLEYRACGWMNVPFGTSLLAVVTKAGR